MFKNIKFSIIFVTIIVLVSLSSVTISSNTIHKKSTNVYNTVEKTKDKDVIAYGISVDDKIIGAAKSKSDIQMALENVKKHFAKDLEIEKIEIIEDIKIVKVNTDMKNIKTEKELLNKIITDNTNNKNSYLTVTTIENKKEIENIPYKTEYKKSDDLYSNQKDVNQKGKEGKKEVVFKIEKRNGIEVAKEILSEKIKSEPINQVVLQGTKKEISSRGTGKFIIPLKGRLTSPFGPRWGSMHLGIDLASPMGTDIKAADNGIVKFSGYKGTYGYMIFIDHGNGYATRYAHSSKLYVSEGQKVAKGETIAAVGSTGRSTGPHLHFEIIVNGENKDPYNYLK